MDGPEYVLADCEIKKIMHQTQQLGRPHQVSVVTARGAAASPSSPLWVQAFNRCRSKFLFVFCMKLSILQNIQQHISCHSFRNVNGWIQKENYICKTTRKLAARLSQAAIILEGTPVILLFFRVLLLSDHRHLCTKCSLC